jgi:hypothetical protein
MQADRHDEMLTPPAAMRQALEISSMTVAGRVRDGAWYPRRVHERAKAPGGSPAERPNGDVEADLIAERLSWTPRERLAYLVDMLDFEDRARRAKRKVG